MCPLLLQHSCSRAWEGRPGRGSGLGGDRTGRDCLHWILCSILGSGTQHSFCADSSSTIAGAEASHSSPDPEAFLAPQNTVTISAPLYLQHRGARIRLPTAQRLERWVEASIHVQMGSWVDFLLPTGDHFDWKVMDTSINTQSTSNSTAWHGGIREGSSTGGTWKAGQGLNTCQFPP